MKRKVKLYLRNKILSDKAIHMSLIDPAKTDPIHAQKIAIEVEAAGSSAIMIGGSVGVSESMVDNIILSIKKKCNLPIILFPGNPSALSRYADAVWFLSVLNSSNPYFITGGQAQGAPIVKAYNIEPLSLGYIILGKGGAVSYISQTRPIPFNKPELAVAYALAAQYMGFEFIYLEGGSGGDPIPPEIIRCVKNNISVPLIVGGGIRTPSLAYKAVYAGADIIVTGTVIEETKDVKEHISEIISAMKKAAREREARISRDEPL